MYCGNCGRNIGDRTVCPYCRGESQPAEAPDYSTLEQFAENTYQQITPDDESKTVLISPSPEPQPQADFSGQPAPMQEKNPPYPPVQNSINTDNAGYAPSATMTPYDEIQPKKKSKKKLVITLVIIFAVLLAGGIATFILTAPMRNYSKAMELKENGQYQEAIEIFRELDDYEDSSAQITDCKYLAAKEMLDDGKFDDAKAAFLKLNGYKDSDELIKECDYGNAMILFNDGKYTKAKEAFEALGDYSDCEEKITACNYHIAKDMVDSDPEAAIDMLNDLGDYEDSKQLLLDAKFNYCSAHKDLESFVTYLYMKDLLDADYDGAKALHDEIYAFRVEDVYWNTDSDNTTKKLKEISEGKPAVLHFAMLGGEPGDKTDTHLKIIWPDNTTDTTDMDGHGRNYTLSLTGSPKGKLTVEIYAGKKNKVYTATVKIV